MKVKNENIQKAIDEIKRSKYLKADGGDFTVNGVENVEYDEIMDNFELFKDDVQSVDIIGYSFTHDIFEDFAAFSKLKILRFSGNALHETEPFFNAGLKKLTTNTPIHTLWIAEGNLSSFPNYLLTLESSQEKLKKLSLIGNNFYQQNFHIPLKECKDNLYELLVNYSKNNYTKFPHLEDYEGTLQKFSWGLMNYSHTIAIIKDDYISTYYGPALSVYVLKTNDKYQTLTKYLNFFKDIHDKEGCFETNEHGDLNYYFFPNSWSSPIVYYEELKRRYWQGETKYPGTSSYRDYFVTDLLVELGGEALVNAIEEEKADTEKQVARNFYQENTRITSFSVANFKIFAQEQTLENLDDINIFVGKNASGKTALLQAIAAALIPRNSNDLGELEKYINGSLAEKPSGLRYARMYARWESFEKGQRIYKDTIEPEIIQPEGKQKAERAMEMDAAEMYRVKLPQSYLVLAYGENLYAQKSPFASKSMDYQDALAKGAYPAHHTAPLFSIAYDKMTNPLDMLNALAEAELKEKNKPWQEELLTIGKLAHEKLNRLLARSSARQLQIAKDGRHYRFYDKMAGHYLDFDQISEGYRSYIILLADIVMHIMASRKYLMMQGSSLEQLFSQAKGAIIIDEFDKHMHPTWQRLFPATLREEFPNMQFFLSTHNIVSVQAAEGEKVYLLDFLKDGTITIEDKVVPVGNEIEEIYRDYFDKKIYSEQTEAHIKDLNKLKKKALIKKDKASLDAYIEKVEAIKKQYGSELSEVFIERLHMDIAYLENALKQELHD